MMEFRNPVVIEILSDAVDRIAEEVRELQDALINVGQRKVRLEIDLQQKKESHAKLQAALDIASQAES